MSDPAFRDGAFMEDTMPRTYYLRRDGSATPNKPWSGDHIMTVRAGTAIEAETRLRYLGPEDVYAQVSVPDRRVRILLCANGSLLGKGLYPHLFVGADRLGSHGIELLEVSLHRLVSEIIRTTEALACKWRLPVWVEIFDGTTTRTEPTTALPRAGEANAWAWLPWGDEDHAPEPHFQLMWALHEALQQGLLSPLVRLEGPKARRIK